MHNKILLPPAEITARDLEFALISARLFAMKASYSDIREMLRALPEHYRERVTALLRDVLCEYPTMKFGVPVLLHVDYTDTAMRPTPLPLPEYAPPDNGVISCGWLSTRTLARAEPFGRGTPRDLILAGRNESAVLLLQCRDATPPELSDVWLGDLFRGFDGHVQISTQAAMPWPDAVEATVAAHVNSLGSRYTPDTPRCFLGFEDYVTAIETGRQFRRRLGIRAGAIPADDSDGDIKNS